MTTYEEVLTFWYEELSPKDWYNGGHHIDQLIKERFLALTLQAKAGELWSWRDTLRGRLAEIIVLDQFSRNIYRGEAEAFTSDDMALVLAQEALKCADLDTLSPHEKQFLYMPFMHAESILMQEWGVKLFAAVPELEGSYQYALAHQKVIEQFGRFPHRNQALNRPSTPEEIEYMKTNKGF